ncbi:MAG: HNH endonuclease [Ruminococcus sp.]
MMKINGESYTTLAVFPNMMTVPDCMVVKSNKIGTGHGEAKLYISSKKEMYRFYGEKSFRAKCFMMKSDLVAYMEAIKNEYMNPSQEYSKKDDLPMLWKKRLELINSLNDVIFFDIYDQDQITGTRGYINSDDRGYGIIREIALPLVSYIYVEKVGSEEKPLFYWKLFVDFDAILEKKNGPLVLTYGKNKGITEGVQSKKNKKDSKQEYARLARKGQGKYREYLLDQCHYCPFTKVSDERLLIASHIKPWAACKNVDEQIDPYNGYILTPLYDKLFDRGFITFTDNKHIILSDFISPYTWKLLKLKNNEYIQSLPMDDKRIGYLNFHHTSVFKGSFDSRKI